MKQLLRKLIAGIETRFLLSHELNELNRIPAQYLKEDAHNFLKLNSKFKPGLIRKLKNETMVFFPLDEGESVKLTLECLGGAKNNDLVIVQRIMGRRKTCSVKVVEILESDLSFSVAIMQENRLLDLYTDAVVEVKNQDDFKLQEGFVYQINNQDRTILAELGNLDDPRIDEAIALSKYNRTEPFNEDVLKEIEAFGDSVDASQYKERKDLRHLEFCTIDPVTAKDFDDAIYYDEEQRTLYVAIADVSSYVQAHSALDAEAYVRGFTVYFPHKSIPMLPRVLSENLCSLNPNVDRLSFVFEMQFDDHHNIIDSKLYEALINSKRRFSYEEIDAYLEGAPIKESDTSIFNRIIALKELTDILRERRLKTGYSFRSPDLEVQLNEEEMIEHTSFAKETPSHGLIEDCMLLANIEAAKRFDIGLYRVHEKPSLAKLDSLYNELATMGLRFKLSANLKETITNIQKAAETIDKVTEIDTLLIQTQMQAHYSSQNIGHFGLGFKEYAHFTSPIRRYSDLIVHRLLKAILKEDKDEISKILQPINAVAIDVSEKERETAACANEFTKRKFARWAKLHIGETFTATLTQNIDNYKCMLDDVITGCEMRLDNVGPSTALFDTIRVTIEDVNLKNGTITATFVEDIEPEHETV